MRSITALALTAFLLAQGSAAIAQEQGSTLEEVLVTAQHRTESALSTPISLFTMNAEQQQRISGLASLNGLVPNLNIDSFPANHQTLRMFIRGVGLTSFPLPDIGLLNANASYNFTDQRQTDSATLFRDSYELINARLSLSEIDCLGGELTIALWGKYLGDEDYEAFTLNNLPQASRAVIWGDGKSYGLDVVYRYF